MELYFEPDKKDLIEKVKVKYQEILDILKLETVVDKVHLDGTPERVAKMLVNELFSGCYEAPPNVKIFKDSNSTPVISSGISIKSICAHHLVPFYGKCSIYYIPNDNDITGLSKFSRLADYFSRRPQIQENLTKQIGSYLVEKLSPQELIVGIKAKHMCICHRGANEDNPITETFYTYSKLGHIEFSKIKYVMDSINYGG